MGSSLADQQEERFGTDLDIIQKAVAVFRGKGFGKEFWVVFDEECGSEVAKVLGQLALDFSALHRLGVDILRPVSDDLTPLREVIERLHHADGRGMMRIPEQPQFDEIIAALGAIGLDGREVAAIVELRRIVAHNKSEMKRCQGNPREEPNYSYDFPINPLYGSVRDAIARRRRLAAIFGPRP